MKQRLICGVLMLMCSLFIYAQDVSEMHENEINNLLKSKYGRGLKIIMSERTNLVSRMYGEEIKKYNNDPIKNVRAFLIENKEFLGIENIDQDIKLERNVSTNLGGRSVH